MQGRTEWHREDPPPEPTRKKPTEVACSPQEGELFAPFMNHIKSLRVLVSSAGALTSEKEGPGMCVYVWGVRAEKPPLCLTDQISTPNKSVPLTLCFLQKLPPSIKPSQQDIKLLLSR